MKSTLNNKELEERAKRIRYFFSDVDGTLTDGCTYYSAHGEEMKKFSHVDGTGFYLLKQVGIIAGIITGENTEIVSRRAEKLKLDHCFLGAANKLERINKFAIDNQCELSEIAYIGDDFNDFELLQQVGISFSPANARKEVIHEVHICSKSNGGDGAFREAVEMLMKLRGVSSLQLFSNSLSK